MPIRHFTNSNIYNNNSKIHDLKIILLNDKINKIKLNIKNQEEQIKYLEKINNIIKKYHITKIPITSGKNIIKPIGYFYMNNYLSNLYNLHENAIYDENKMQIIPSTDEKFRKLKLNIKEQEQEIEYLEKVKYEPIKKINLIDNPIKYGYKIIIEM